MKTRSIACHLVTFNWRFRREPRFGFLFSSLFLWLLLFSSALNLLRLLPLSSPKTLLTEDVLIRFKRKLRLFPTKDLYPTRSLLSRRSATIDLLPTSLYSSSLSIPSGKTRRYTEIFLFRKCMWIQSICLLTSHFFDWPSHATGCM